MFSMIIISVNSSSQLINKWEIVDTDTIYYYNSNDPIAKNISYIDKNDISIIGYYLKNIKRTFFTPEHIKVEILTNANIWSALQFSGFDNTKKKVILYDTNQIDDHWRAIAHPSNNIYVIVGDSASFMGYFDWLRYKFHSLLLISKNAGSSWERSTYDSNKIFMDISMCDSNNGIIYQKDSSNYFNLNKKKKYDTLLITNDCWKTYIKKALPENSNNKLYCINPSSFIVLCRDIEKNKDYLSITTNAGENWFNSSYLDFKITCFKFINETKIFVGGYKALNSLGNAIPKLTMSTDFGLTWNNILLYDDEYKPDWGGIKSIDFYNELDGVAAGDDLIYTTTDAGFTWNKEVLPFKFYPDGSNIISIVDIVYPDNTLIFSIATNGQIIANKNEKILSKPSFKKILDSRYQKVYNVNIQWSSVVGANKYRLKIDSTKINFEDYNFDHPLIDTVLSDTSIILNKLNYNCQFGAWVKAINDNSESDWAESRKLFSTIATEGVLYPPELLEPEQGYLAKPPEIKLIWTKVPNAVSYNLSIKDMVDNKTIFNQSYIADTSYIYPGFKPSTMYFISLSSTNKDSTSIFSNFMLFTYYEPNSIYEKKSLPLNVISVFPNPVENNCMYEINSNFNSISILKIYNLLGELVQSKEILLKENNNKYQLNTENFLPGIYFVEIINSNDIKRGIFIKQ